MRHRWRAAPAVCALAAACARESPQRASGADSTRASRAQVPATELEAAARALVAFLQGRSPGVEMPLADTVVLVVAPEGGGARAALPRERLRTPAGWVVGAGARRHAFAPPHGLSKLTARVGRHFACVEQPLSTRDSALAALPHVGTKLEPDAGGSCLQTWNVTFVFDSTARPPRLVAAVYDQWEW